MRTTLSRLHRRLDHIKRRDPDRRTKFEGDAMEPHVIRDGAVKR